jgi:hypothetical protein
MRDIQMNQEEKSVDFGSVKRYQNDEKIQVPNKA